MPWTPGLRSTYEWMTRTNFGRTEVLDVLVVRITDDSDRGAIVFPDGSYRAIKIGQIHGPPVQRQVP